MGQRESDTTLSDTVDDFFEPELGDAIEEILEEDELKATGKGRLAELRRRAEQRMEEKRMRDDLDYLELDWDDA